MFRKPKPLEDESDQQRLLEIKLRINDMYSHIPDMLVDRPDLQKVCLAHLKVAEEAYARTDVISCRLALADIDVEMTLTKRERFATILTFIVVYASLALAGMAAFIEPDADRMLKTNAHSIAGVPEEIWIWALLGSICAMLLRVSNYNFGDRQEAKRWAISRPIIGMVMGSMAFMLMKMGILVIDAPDSSKLDYLNLVVGFIGGFSDGLSVSMLNKLQEKLTGAKPGSIQSEVMVSSLNTPRVVAPPVDAVDAEMLEEAEAVAVAIAEAELQGDRKPAPAKPATPAAKPPPPKPPAAKPTPPAQTPPPEKPALEPPPAEPAPSASVTLEEGGESFTVAVGLPARLWEP